LFYQDLRHFKKINPELSFVFSVKDMAPIRKSRAQQKQRRGPTSAEVLRVVRSIAEKKVYVGGATGQATAATGTVWALSQGIIQGDAVNSRDGTQVTIQSINIRVDVFMPTATIAAGVRVIIFSDTQNNGSLPAVVDVLDNASYISPYSIIQQVTRRFRVHADSMRNLTAGGTQQVVFNVNRSFTQKVSYNGSTDVAASNGKNALFMLIITDVGSGFPTYDFSHNIRYLDM
jgi:hypothetical protein